MEVCTPLPNRPPPPPPATNFIDKLLKSSSGYYLVSIPYFLLLALLFCLVLLALRKRLWLLPSVHPSRLLSLNAGTLALLGILTKVAKPWDMNPYPDEYHMLGCNVLICAVVGTLLPSIATSTDIRDVWSNVLGIGLLIVSTNFFIFLQIFYVPDNFLNKPTINDKAKKHEVVMAFLFLLLLVILVQTTALEEIISDMKGTVLEQLEQLCREFKPGYNTNVVVLRPNWSWEVMERNAHIKLMMVLTSSPQNVMTRSPCVAIVGTIVLSCILTFDGFGLLQSGLVLSFGVICGWRWLMVSLCEERSLSSLIFNAEPSYWRRKVKYFQIKLKASQCKEGQYGVKEVVYPTASFLILCFVLPLQWLLVAMIRWVHIFSVLLMQKFFWLPVKSLGCAILTFIKRLCKIKTPAAADPLAESSTKFEVLGVVCLEGEDAGTVQRQFSSAHNRIIQTQMKKAKTKLADLKDLVILLKGIKNPSSLLHQSKGILDLLHPDGAPYVENLHVEHGYQYGWSLTMVALLEIMTEIEVTALGTSVVSDVAVNACWQAMEMMQVVDEQFVPCILCSKETYAKAFALEWSKLVEKMKIRRLSKKRKQVMCEVEPDKILMLKLEPVERHMKDFNKARSSTCGYIAAAWSQETVVAYTMHTMCKNLLRWWRDPERAATVNSLGGGGEESNNAREIIKGMVEHINVLLAEVLACCFLNLSTALDMSTTEAVRSVSMSKIEKGLFLVAQGKHIWEELQWPATLHSSKSTAFRLLRQCSRKQLL